MNITRGVSMSALTQDNDFIQGSPEWLSFRKKYIGASDAPIIMQISPWKTPYQLWLEKLDLVPPGIKNSAMERGLQLESEARLTFSIKTGIDMSPKVVIHPSVKWMMASLDGLSNDKKNAVEIKCPGKTDHAVAAQGKVPEKYYPQLQHQMEVAQLDMIFYYSFHEEFGDYIIEVNRDDKFIKKMKKEEEQFYDCVQSFISPKLTDRDYETRNDDVWTLVTSDWKYAKSQLNDWEETEKRLRENLISYGQ